MLHTLKPAHGSTKQRKRVARGNSAGGGTTAGRGTKGQQSRTGRKRKQSGFEGGQTPLLRRLPKSGGFRNPRRVEFEPVNIGALEALPAGEYNAEALRAQRLLTSSRPVKLLGKGSVSKKFTLHVHATSESARKAIEAAGGSITIVR